MRNSSASLFWPYLCATLFDGLRYTVVTPDHAIKNVSQSFRGMHHINNNMQYKSSCFVDLVLKVDIFRPAYLFFHCTLLNSSVHHHATQLHHVIHSVWFFSPTIALRLLQFVLRRGHDMLYSGPFYRRITCGIKHRVTLWPVTDEIPFHLS